MSKKLLAKLIYFQVSLASNQIFHKIAWDYTGTFNMVS